LTGSLVRVDLQRLHVGFFLLAVFLVASVFGSGSVGATAPCDEGCGLLAQSDIGLMIGGLSGLFALVYRQLEPVPQPDLPVLIWRRMVAFYIDVFVAVFTIISTGALLLLVMRFLMTGIWVWQFILTDNPTSPVLEFLLVIVTLVALFAYFRVHAGIGRATIGQYILGYEVIPDPASDAPPRYALGLIMAFFAMCSVHMWIWFMKDRDSREGWYWWERFGGTRARMVSKYPWTLG
jgi:hypothetical protein